MTDKPEHAPVHRTPVWLSELDVKAILTFVAEAGGDKATLWDVLYQVNLLVKLEQQP